MVQGRANARARGLVSQGWRNVRAAGGRRLTVTALLLVVAILLARFSWSLPVLGNAELALYDLRDFVTAPSTEQDGRVQLVSYTDQTLIAVRKRSPLDRGLLARALRNLDSMGAKAIGIDILFDQPQNEDDDLIAALRAMKTPVFVGYAQVASNKDNIIYDQQRYLDEFMQRLAGSNAHPASVRLNYADNAARSWPARLAGLPPLLGPAMLAAAGNGKARRFADYTGPIRYRHPLDKTQPVFSSLPIDQFGAQRMDPELGAAFASIIKDRYVLIGGEIVDIDRFDTPFTPFTGESIPGVRIHAAMIAQMLDGARYATPMAWEPWAMVMLVVIAAAFTALLDVKFWKLAPYGVAQLVLFAGLPFLLQMERVDTLGTPAVGWAVGWIVAFTAVSAASRASGAVERKFAQDALGRYLPRDIAQEIIDHPERLALSGTSRQLYILFSDLEGFTELSHQLEPEVVAKLLNDYLDRLSAVVLEHGGLIDKYVGDAVVAFWGAPIARPDDAEKAARAGYALWQAGEEFRRSVDPSLPKVGRTRVGLHFGEAVVGNFGGERRIQYTALGDAMNTASRLESANKSLKTSVLASREFLERSGLDWWRPMGRVRLRGRAQPVDIFEPAPDFPAEDMAALIKAMSILDTDKPAAMEIVRAVASRHPSDDALQNLLERMGNLEEYNAYVMG